MDDRVGTDWLVRDATGDDAAACARIYEPYVRDTVVSFELEPPTAAEVAGRIAAALARHAWLVLEDDGRVVGYAYGSTFNARAAYDWTTSVSVYTEPGRRRTGAGRALYTALLDRLAARGYRTALAGIALPNDASVGLHTAMGFELVGTYRRVGWKLGRWNDVARYQRPLGEPTDDAPPERPGGTVDTAVGEGDTRTSN
ncbi:GNAT family N-acetyltransferase [Geodermatophilus obscurus]|uniref:Phosphinothricin acetyltransferase n=1 Tax=Geodermatophilus obscurus (strain ATCC 25078 / DSM 43160 / JCM 3152 / CCUG 61914 / KCC A-0152 / KCTC 9177 / NBRC 13315 / NRRL B-3577 / G-20) TaxID=526225 RepID=D2SGR4_GEOOG|nr:GNAT family N-acetyltransferase [Geodermatophilus obscurus]ADB74907.1 Phosphinothricin acetyltransferase [Geodermatophilus obscurus DSM 43160]